MNIQLEILREQFRFVQQTNNRIDYVLRINQDYICIECLGIDNILNEFYMSSKSHCNKCLKFQSCDSKFYDILFSLSRKNVISWYQLEPADTILGILYLSSVKGAVRLTEKASNFTEILLKHLYPNMPFSIL